MSNAFDGIVRDGRIVLADGTELADGLRVHVVIESRPLPADPPDAAPASEEGTIHTPLEDPALIELLTRIRRDRLPLPPGPGRKSAAGWLADDPTWDEHLREVLDSRKASTDREFPG